MSIDKDLQQAVAEAIYYHMFPDRPDTFYDDEWLYTRYYDCAGKAIEAYEAAKASEQPVDCREAFNEWCGIDGNFHLGSTSHAQWLAWQAAWNARATTRESGSGE